MSKRKVFVGYSNCYFKNFMRCQICGKRFDSGDIEYGFVMRNNGSIDPDSAICEDCMKAGTKAWPALLQAHADRIRDVIVRDLLQEANEIEKMIDDEFILPSAEEAEEIRAAGRIEEGT